MNKKVRDQSQIIDDIRNLVRENGFIYTLCMILFEDNHIIVEELNSVNYHDRLNKNEISLLLGYLIQNEIDLSPPEDPWFLLELKAKTYKLFEELHSALNNPLFDKMRVVITSKTSQSEYPSIKELYSGDKTFIEPIFYANDGVYDFQFLNYLKVKYKFDEEWLKEKRNFDFDKTIAIVQKIRDIANKRCEKTNFFSLKEKVSELKKLAKKSFNGTKSDFETEYEENKGIAEFLQFSSLFLDSTKEDIKLTLEHINEQGWELFYKNIIELFVIRKSDFDARLNFDAFLNNFSQKPSKNTNKKFNNVGDFNEFTACPLIKLDDERYFFPITYSISEAVYECPYYWMTNDKNYLDLLGKHRGITGEEISYDILSNVFGKSNTFRSIKIETRKGFVDTDIDVLCILGSKAICVQVKSKKLTQTTKQGSYKTLLEDFKGAVQDAYNQGLICREKIIENKAKFYDSNGNDFILPLGIDEVYIMGVTSENFPALTHQSHILLEKNATDPNALFMSFFDLEIVGHYLNNPYDFLYYIKQRITFSEKIIAENELLFLSYHLQKKLTLDNARSFLAIDSSLGGDIDRDYYPLKMCLKVSDKNNRIKQRWRSLEFEELCNCITKIDTPFVTDVIFSLYDWDSKTREEIVKHITYCKQETKKDGKQHDRTLVSDLYAGSRSGLTFHSFGFDNVGFQKDLWINHCRVRKYHSKADSWIGLASIPESKQMIDLVVYNNQPWEYDKVEEQLTKELLPITPQYIRNKYKTKPQRNESCPCGSGKKYKKCCGKN